MPLPQSSPVSGGSYSVDYIDNQTNVLFVDAPATVEAVQLQCLVDPSQMVYRP